MTGIFLLSLCLLGSSEELRLSLFIDPNMPEQKALLIELGKARQAGVDALWGDATIPMNREHLAHWGLTGTPLYILYCGHRVVTQYRGRLTERQIVDWFARARRDAPAPVWSQPSTYQNRLAVQDRPRYRQVMTPGSCGMAGCQAHGGGMRLIPIP